jgi:hypothetical protein
MPSEEMHLNIGSLLFEDLDQIDLTGPMEVLASLPNSTYRISPLLANIYLYYVLDLWAEQSRRREATGDMIIVRYADDVVAGFAHESYRGRRVGEYPEPKRLLP